MDSQASTSLSAEIASSEIGGDVQVKGRQKHLTLSETGITIASSKQSANVTELSVVWCDVIGCETSQPQDGKDSESSQIKPGSTASMVIHYVQQKDKTLRQEKVKIKACPELLASWSGKIREYGLKVPGRPRKTVTIINPISGNRQGPNVFAKIVEPVLQLAGIQNTTLTTQKEREAVELAENLDLTAYDSIILIGGDGLHHEILAGLTKQVQQRAGVNISDPDAEFKPISIPIGIIPTGTGNAVSFWANGIIDVETAILNIMRGKIQRAQVSSVHSNGKLLGMSGVNVVYGMMSDMIRHTDRLRWMKAKRYSYAMLAMILGKKRLFDCKIEYKTSSGQPHGAQGEQTMERSCGTSQDQDTDDVWHTYDPEGKPYRGLMSFSCDLDLSEPRRKKAVQFVTGDSTHLIIDHNILAPKYIKYLLNYLSPLKSTNTSPKLAVLQNVTAFRFSLVENGQSTQNDHDRELQLFAAMDGESVALEAAELDVRVRKSYVPLYGCIDQSQDCVCQDDVN